jgi:hypothetical protein
MGQRLSAFIFHFFHFTPTPGETNFPDEMNETHEMKDTQAGSPRPAHGGTPVVPNSLFLTGASGRSNARIEPQPLRGKRSRAGALNWW